MALSVNVTFSAPPEVIEEIDANRGPWSRSRYIRHAIKACDGTPFEIPEGDFPDLEAEPEAEAGGVA